MAKVLYNLSIELYQWLIRLVSPFNQKAQLWLKGREGLFEKLEYQLTQARQKSQSPLSIAWFHCASLGEFEQGRPVIEAYKKEFPNHHILLTFFSPSGYEIRKNYEGADFICYLPADTPSNAKRFVELINPTVAFFVKYEFWYNYLNYLKQANIPSISFSTIFRENQVYFKSYGEFNRSILRLLTHIFVQNEKSASLLAGIQIQENVSIAGDTRFDRVAQIAQNKRVIPIAEQFKNDTQTLIVGSCWQQDFDVICPLINSFAHPLKVIIAPHEIHPEEIVQWQKQLKKPSIRYSEALNGKELSNAEVLFIDNIGMLSSLYQYADYAWIGGAYGKGLHNTLEAATFGLPIFFGNKVYTKFQEAMDLIAIGGAQVIDNTQTFESIFTSLYQDFDKRKEVSDKILTYVKSNIGSTQTIINFVKNLIQTTNK